MTKHTLFVCTSCHRSSAELSENQHRDGTRLLEQLNTLSGSGEKLLSSQMEIKPLGCLWACSRGCVVAISSPEKPTYLLVDLPPDESAVALLELMQMYIRSGKRAIPWKQLPQFLQSAIFAQIPSVLIDENAE
ncbi:MAG: DUF1636 family protein [Goleter apudmare HA4340-LM2]|jgi:predicted metal-binding protein|nr:DUF1636 family protein [Goleter apudmare HA4340-LM2]